MESCREQFHRSFGIYGYLERLDGKTVPVIIQINSGYTRFEVVDPNLPSSDPNCLVFDKDGYSCPILKVDYHQLSRP